MHLSGGRCACLKPRQVELCTSEYRLSTYFRACLSSLFEPSLSFPSRSQHVPWIARLTCMRKVYWILTILVLVISHSAAGQDSAPRTSRLKSIELAGAYKIQVPGDFEVNKWSDKVSAVPMYDLREYHPPYTTIEVMV